MADDTYSRSYRTPPGRGGAGAGGSSIDPLTELARLIGQSDPFAPDGQRGSPARPTEPPAQADDWRAAPQPYASPYDDRSPDQHYAADDRDYGHDHAHAPPADPHGDNAYQAGYDGQAYPDQPYEAERESAGGQPGYEPAGPVPFGSPGDGADAHGEPHEDMSHFYDDEAPAPRRRGWLVTAAAFVGLAVVGTAGAFAYRAVFSGGVPSIIARDPGPNKIIPANQNADSRSNKRVDRIASGGQDERMVSHEEQPITLPATQNAPADGQPADASAPRPVSTVKIKPDLPPDSSAPAMPAMPVAPPAAAPTAPAAAVPRPPQPRATAAQAPAQPAPAQVARAVPPPAPRAAANAPLSLAPDAVASAAPPPPHAVARSPAAATGEGGSGYFVQVTAQKSEAEAQSSFHGIQEKYAGVLGSHQAVIHRKDLGSKGIFYAAWVGPLSHEGAVSLCESLKSAGGSCMIQRN